eukprot:XP_020397404.1 zinc finger BED domain-containing protein RICESLEEPER 2-like [Zea mays]
MEKCLAEWGLDKVFTITVDNASANNGAVSYMAKVTNKSKTSILESKLLHMRCAAHIVNLIVQEGLKELDISIKHVRAAVKFIKSSPSRIAKFKKCAELEKVNTKAFLALDVVTRWNSTYNMLKVAVAYEKVFERYAEDDPYYAIDLNGEKQPGVPDSDDWASAAKMAEFLEHFHKLTIRVSATLRPTAHIFFHEVAELNILLRSWCESSDPLRNKMAKRMLAKYNKYWGDHTSFNILIFVAVALDPRYKLSNYTKIATLEMFGEVHGEVVWIKMNETLTKLFGEYGRIYAPSDKDGQTKEANNDQEEEGSSLMRTLVAKRLKSNNCSVSASKSELEKYLAEENEEQTTKFNIMEWWKVNSTRFPILGRLARDVLAIPISTVASESAFSTGGRILDDFRSSLTPFMVEALVCTQDWMRHASPITNEEDTEELAKLEEALLAEMNSLNTAKASRDKEIVNCG